MNVEFSKLIAKTIEAGAFKAEVIAVSTIKTDPYFRKLCEMNHCGNYNKNWMCPPHIGKIDELIDEIRNYEWALVYQTVGELEDSFDFEGMMEAQRLHDKLVFNIRKVAEGFLDKDARMLLLGAGGCKVCEDCSKRSNKPCRHPESAVSSLEAYGIDVSQLAKAAGMKYTNGNNTVTYFGALLFG